MKDLKVVPSFEDYSKNFNGREAGQELKVSELLALLPEKERMLTNERLCGGTAKRGTNDPPGSENNRAPKFCRSETARLLLLLRDHPEAAEAVQMSINRTFGKKS